MFYQHNPVFDVLPGTIWSDIHHEINQQMVFKEYGEFTIERGTPLAVYIPYKRTKYNFKITNYTEEAQKWEAKIVLWLELNLEVLIEKNKKNK
jgi:hypothetical protein